jgi:filamentous hemagglutinin
MLARGLSNGRALTPDEQEQLRGMADQSVIQVDGREIAVEHAAPLIPVAIWVTKATAETGLDAFMEYALASLTGTDPPGFWDHAGNFAINMVGGGPAKKLRTIARITEAVDNMRDTLRVISQIPGGRQLVDEIGQLGSQLKSALDSGNLDQAKAVYDRLVNKLGNARSLATDRSNMLTEMSRNGVKYNEANIVRMARGQDGKIVFLETGSATAGLNHVLTRHSADFARRGVPEDQIPDLLIAALTQGRIVGQQGSNANRLRPIYEVVFNGQRQRVAISTGNNGFVVGANPA